MLLPASPAIISAAAGPATAPALPPVTSPTPGALRTGLDFGPHGAGLSLASAAAAAGLRRSAQCRLLAAHAWGFVPGARGLLVVFFFRTRGQRTCPSAQAWPARAGADGSERKSYAGCPAGPAARRSGAGCPASLGRGEARPAASAAHQWQPPAPPPRRQAPNPCTRRPAPLSRRQRPQTLPSPRWWQVKTTPVSGQAQASRLRNRTLQIQQLWDQACSRRYAGILLGGGARS